MLRFNKINQIVLVFLIAVTLVNSALAEDLSDRVSDRLDTVEIGTHDLEISNWRGDVTLRGTVGSTADKDLVLQTAKSVDGVDRIIDELRVDSNLAAAGRAMIRDVPNDNLIMVKNHTDQYLKNQNLKGSYKLEYIADADNVIVKGELPAGTDKQRLANYWEKSFNFGIVDQVLVRPWPSDAILKERVSSELASKLNLNIKGIGVSVANGIVTLTGHRANHFEADQLATGVWMVEGVRGLESKVTFNGSRDDPMSAIKQIK